LFPRLLHSTLRIRHSHGGIRKRSQAGSREFLKTAPNTKKNKCNLLSKKEVGPYSMTPGARSKTFSCSKNQRHLVLRMEWDWQSFL